MRVVGLMSGTSMDGIDAALIETDGEHVFWLGPAVTVPYDAPTRALLERAMADARGVNARTDRPGALAEAERRITDLHAEAVRALLVPLRLTLSDIDLVGFHGQTVLHRPEARLTVQIGEGARLAALLGVPVMADFRAADVAAGGQGAPLVPVFHAALAAPLGGPRPLAVLNVGGVANVTVIDGVAAPVACDTGPGNALLDDFMQERTGRPFDADGAAAARGRVDEAAVAAALDHPFFREPPPKSLDRNAFRAHAAGRLGLSGLSLEDGAATLTALTAASVAAVLAHLPAPPRRWIVAGGGARNPTLMAMLAQRLGAEVVAAEAVGWSADALEAHAFGFLAARAARGLPLTFPTTTGVSEPLTGGVLFEP
ncbi:MULTISPECIES: anhydro-N-acetylmuramic acid kinase [unclassified Xanthobacter]|uniref:anhydro-N-acetylmuramic acid kinase n=1 Tax=unclassified Xanthobacter TaxID=2623496 RepID=UPI001F229D3A|nr:MULTISPECIES: anhydro-N-acetylmuramic acid kinase [unclassified Xanthobacter]